ncbi:hypothetical protein G1K52_04195 [Tenacibaculum finnmarkense]|uniref:hypothetical protein n=1 Tax=Tenacibaculum finnmarkense TaxID=2781243 RepID=UPI001EFC293A|nr:hypothetical protein [Tenacibaculum finnmarkense]MCG8784960.1 hypothetical protein [Tenacibaculum finnmarkense]
MKNDESLSKLIKSLDIHDIKILNPILNEIEKINIVHIKNVSFMGIIQTYVIYKDSYFGTKQYNSYLITYSPNKIEKRLLFIYHILKGHIPTFGGVPNTFIVNKNPKRVNLIYSNELGIVELDLIKVPVKSIHPELHLKNISDWFKFQITQIYLKNPYDGIVGLYKNIELILPTRDLFGYTDIQDIIKRKEENSFGIGKSIDSLSRFHISIYQKKIFASYYFEFYQGDNPRDGSISIELMINDLYDKINNKAIYINDYYSN